MDSDRAIIRQSGHMASSVSVDAILLPPRLLNAPATAPTPRSFLLASQPSRTTFEPCAPSLGPSIAFSAPPHDSCASTSTSNAFYTRLRRSERSGHLSHAFPSFSELFRHLEFVPSRFRPQESTWSFSGHLVVRPWSFSRLHGLCEVL